MREHSIGHSGPGHDERSGEERHDPDEQRDPTGSEPPANREDGRDGGCDGQRAEPPEGRGEEARPFGIRQLEEIHERQPDALEHGVETLIEPGAPTWITRLGEVEHEPERSGRETDRSRGCERPPARPRLACEDERDENGHGEDDRPLRADG